MKAFVLLFLLVIVFLVRGECQTCQNYHIQVIKQDQACYGDHNGYIYVQPPDTGHCPLCDMNGFYISRFEILDSAGDEVQGNDYLESGTYTLIAVMSCHSADNGAVLTIDSINEPVTLAQPPFPNPVYTTLIDTSQNCSGGEIAGYVGAPEFVIYNIDHGELCAYLELQHKENGITQPPLSISISGDSGSFDIHNFVAGQYRFIYGTYTTLKTDTTPWITMNICSVPSSGFGTKAVTSTSAVVLWNPWPCAQHFKVRYKKQNASGWKTASVINAFTFGAARLAGLEAGTTYQWQVQSLCSYDPDLASSFSPMQTFTTLKSQERNEMGETSNYSAEKIMVFPNPASNEITLANSAPEGMATVSIYNALGEQVLNTSWNTDEGKTSLDVSHLRSGMYEVIVRNDLYTGTGTFIRQ